MPLVSTTAYSPAEDALSLARSIVNDASGQAFADAVLMPFLNTAYRTLQREVAENGVTVLVAQLDLDLPLTDGLTPTETRLRNRRDGGAVARKVCAGGRFDVPRRGCNYRADRTLRPAGTIQTAATQAVRP
jgi:hypothetical protein